MILWFFCGPGKLCSQILRIWKPINKPLNVVGHGCCSRPVCRDWDVKCGSVAAMHGLQEMCLQRVAQETSNLSDWGGQDYLHLLFCGRSWYSSLFILARQCFFIQNTLNTCLPSCVLTLVLQMNIFEMTSSVWFSNALFYVEWSVNLTQSTQVITS